MYMIAEVSQYVAVASFAEAWIEIAYPSLSAAPAIVASFAEAWIEIFFTSCSTPSLSVASFAEAWIEMILYNVRNNLEPDKVASFAEAWIEILQNLLLQ